MMQKVILLGKHPNSVMSFYIYCANAMLFYMLTLIYFVFH
jgi:hypothetical protein